MTSRGRQLWSAGSARFGRDILVSVLATGIATLGLAALRHEDASAPVAIASVGKVADRLTWEVEDVPVRHTRIYDTVAMFSIPQPEAAAWSEAPPVPAKLAEATPTHFAPRRLRLAQANGEARSAFAVPPVRPAAPQEVRTASLATAAEPDPHSRSLRLLGWDVPGTGLLSSLPSGQQVLHSVVAFGESAASAGGSLVETVGLK